MIYARNIFVFFMVLSFAFGSAMGVASAAEQAFAEPCPMQDQGHDCPCCKGDCTPAMMGCSSHCSAPMAADMPKMTKLIRVAIGHKMTLEDARYDPFITRPPPPIPIV